MPKNYIYLADMENIMAENRILRKIAGVPENYGFDLEEVKLAEL